MNRTVLSRVLPFAAFMTCVGLEELFRFLLSHGFVSFSSTVFLYTYPVRMILVAGLLFYYRHHYTELQLVDLFKLPMLLLSVFFGGLVFFVWITLSDPVQMGLTKAPGYNPLLLPPLLQIPLICIRVFSAVVVVPVMEELFWRSFLIRYLINQDFKAVPLGQYTLSSFLITVIFFGFEHHLILAGMAAGFLYNLLLYRTKSLMQCVLAHGVTNMILACYVVYFHRWDLW